MKITLHKILFINLLIVQIILAGQGSAGAKFLQINATTRGSANGGTLVARPGLIDALSYNPATAATLTGANSIIHHSDYFVGMSFDYMSFAYNMPARDYWGFFLVILKKLQSWNHLAQAEHLLPMILPVFYRLHEV